MTSATASPRQVAERLLRAVTGPDPGDIADCYAPEVVIEMPFAVAPLYPARIETTREELRARFRAGAAVRRYTRLTDVTIHETTGPGVVIAEYELHGHLASTAEPFSQRFVMVMTVRDGQIVHTRDYTNPITGARLLGKMPELLAVLGASEPAQPA
ncbi:MAG: nuclear transport factor 2 family protein [Nocardiopsaceae bacterium]|jgi:ketosteroid isomerase-like protein|nr:nuclear transport factor 2 family protein [Nocardiopsaceae bacterium]